MAQLQHAAHRSETDITQELGGMRGFAMACVTAG
jgi:hypothetical protein